MSAADERDAWLDHVRRWFHGGTPPVEPPAREAAPRPPDGPATAPSPRTPWCTDRQGQEQPR